MYWAMEPECQRISFSSGVKSPINQTLTLVRVGPLVPLGSDGAASVNVPGLDAGTGVGATASDDGAGKVGEALVRVGGRAVGGGAEQSGVGRVETWLALAVDDP